MNRILPAGGRWALMASLLAWAAVAVAEDRPRVVEMEHGSVKWRAVVVPANAHLAHTAQVYAATDGQPPGDAARQFHQALGKLEQLLQPLGATLDDVVRLNVYAATREAAEAIRAVYSNQRAMAVTYVVSGLEAEGALVAVDAVAAVAEATSPDIAQVRVLPAGGATFISGMAADGDMAAATHATLVQLAGVLEYFGLTLDDVVHLKAFLQPVDRTSAARQTVGSFFGGAPPPSSWVEWTMSKPIEIELVARAARENVPEGDTASYHNPPPSRVSTTFTRAVLTHGGQLIYTSGLVAGAELEAESEVRDLLTGMRQLVGQAGSDFDHLVKATYYPADEATSAALNAVRPEFYNPQRPPAASKAPVRGSGHAARQITLDMIAVTRE